MPRSNAGGPGAPGLGRRRARRPGAGPALARSWAPVSAARPCGARRPVGGAAGVPRRGQRGQRWLVHAECTKRTEGADRTRTRTPSVGAQAPDDGSARRTSGARGTCGAVIQADATVERGGSLHLCIWRAPTKGRSLRHRRRVKGGVRRSARAWRSAAASVASRSARPSHLAARACHSPRARGSSRTCGRSPARGRPRRPASPADSGAARAGRAAPRAPAKGCDLGAGCAPAEPVRRRRSPAAASAIRLPPGSPAGGAGGDQPAAAISLRRRPSGCRGRRPGDRPSQGP